MSDFSAERHIEFRQVQARLAEIRTAIFSDRRPIGPIAYAVTGPGRGPERAPKTGWKPLPPHGRWGGYDQTTWFRMHAVIPKAFRGKCVVALIRSAAIPPTEALQHLSAPGEATAFVNGAPFQGLDMNRDELFLVQRARGGERFEIALEAVPSVRYDAHHTFQYADLAVLRPEVWEVYWDIETALKVYESLGEDTATARKLLALLAKGVRLVDLQHKDGPAFTPSCRAASRFVQEGLKQFSAANDAGRLVLIGHSHIDTAWLWPLRETRRKVGRTFSTMLNLLDRYPEFHFSFSQPELYMYAKEHYPELWARLRKRVKEGRWEPCGAPWVEQDSNCAGAEALVRQFLYGNRFFRKEFGMHSRTAWLPDAFGYPWSLPQIMKQCQIDTFVTTKIDWGMFTKFPYSMFQWQGVDGTRIFALMPPLSYNGNPTPKNCIEQWARFKQKEHVEELPLPYGWGDGGGGPTMEMIEHGKRLANIAGVPKCEFGRTQDCLDRMQAQCEVKRLPVYNDELYLELHRGCQTTQARTKRNNRKSEVLLRETEFLSSLAHLHGAKYDGDALWRAWRTVLTNQFHDILPGSSITEVYTQADKDYAEAQAKVRQVQAAARAHLASRIDTRGAGTPVLVYNTLSWVRTDHAEVQVPLPRGAFHVTGPGGDAVPHQKIAKDRLLIEARALPPLGYAVYHVVPGKAPEPEDSGLRVSNTSIENDYLHVRFDAFGRFTRVFDKAEQREVLPKGEKANVLQMFEDRPHDHDAWDIDHNFDQEPCREPGKATQVEVIESGPVRAVVRLHRHTERSTFVQDLILYAAQPRIEVRLHVDWQEKRTLLKAAFPVDVLSPRAAFDIQFGVIERATHRNNAHERGRFEVTAHKWADLSEGGYGVSLLNDCKYGYDVKDNVLRLSLLRSSVDPDPHADEGRHEMLYSLFPHADDWRGGTVTQGYELNYPLLAHVPKAGPGELPPVHSFAAVSTDNVIVESIKKHEDSNAIIVRVYEALGSRGPATLTFGPKPKAVYACDMMEENDEALRLSGHNVRLDFTPFQIRTLKLRF